MKEVEVERMMVNSSNGQFPLPSVVTPTTSTTLPSTTVSTAKQWPPPPSFPHHPAFPPDHPSSAMFGLHNILLITPSSSCHHHHHHHHIHEQPPPFSASPGEPSFWSSLKKRHDSTTNENNKAHDDQDDNDNEEEDDHENQNFMKVCKDCGNRAKKECSFSRCRTCCKSRGYDCATHVRSTWIPASKRRDKKFAIDGGSAASASSSSGAKRSRLPVPALSSANLTTTTSSDLHLPTLCFTGSVPQDASFKKALPGQVKAPAVFRCISVTSISDGEDNEVGYVGTVNISGHVFKGFLYDQGVCDEKNLFPCISSKTHNMEANSSAKNRDSSSFSPIVDPSSTFAASAT